MTGRIGLVVALGATVHAWGGALVVPPPTSVAGGAFTLITGSNGAGEVSVTEEAEDVFVHRSTDANGVPSNGLVAITGRGLLLVDTAWTEAQTEAILKWGHDELERPWIGAVLTHGHADRVGGLGALDRWHIPTAALDLTLETLARRGIRNVTMLFRARDGVFRDERGFEAFYPGPGHAPDNIVVRFPTVLFGGCLIKSMEAKDLGFTGDADLGAWPASVRRVRQRYGKMTIVPGHGSVDRAGASYQHTLDLLEAPKP